MHHDAAEVSLLALIGLGAWHGLNPAMGWLFAVALGMQEGSHRAVWRALLPLAAGHALSVAAVLGAAAALGAVVPATTLRLGAAGLLVSFAIYRLASTRHPRWGGMQVGFRDLTIWSFLMASAHGAGLMLLPLVMPGRAAHGTASGLVATGVHTVAYLAVTGTVAWVVHAHLGLGLLRRAWLNLDVLWAGALLLAGVVILL